MILILTAAADTSNFDPWGRPGAGAPVRDNRGNILADYNNRKVISSHHLLYMNFYVSLF